MRTGAVVALKGLEEAKGRLGGLLAPEERRGLALAMLDDVLGTVEACTPVDVRLFVSPDPRLRERAAGRGFEVLADEGRGMVAAFDLGLRWCEEAGCGAAVAIPADLPLLSPRDLAAALAALGGGPRAVIVPSWGGGGTSLLALAPPRVIPLHFEEPRSHVLHAAEARRRGIPHRLLHLPGPALDIDSPGDLRELRRRGGRCRALEYLQSTGLGRRLGQRVVP